MSTDFLPFKRYVGAFNNVSRVAFGTDYVNGEIGIASGFYYSLVAVANEFVCVNLSANGDVNITVAPPEKAAYPQMFVEAPSFMLEDADIQNTAIQVASEMADLLNIRELHLGRQYWTFISKNGINLPPGWDMTNSSGGEIHLERA